LRSLHEACIRELQRKAQIHRRVALRMIEARAGRGRKGRGNPASMIDEIDECYRPRRQTERRAQGRARDPGIERVADERGRRQLRAILENIVAGDPAENRTEARIAPVAHVKIDAIRPAYSEIALAQVQYVANL